MQKVLKDPMSDIFGEDLKMCVHTKVQVDGQIEGCWSLPKSKNQCRACGATLLKVPRKGHVNSKFWVNEQPDGMILKACPKGCTEEDAGETFRVWNQYREFVKGEMCNWDWDYTKFKYGWITPSAGFIFCAYMGHTYCLPNDICTHMEAEKAGYIKFTSDDGDIEFSWGKKPNKYQSKRIRDCAIDRNYPLSKCDEYSLTDANNSILMTVK